jgi:pimeloyl-ACP methyl ester carboxylesterase
VAALDARITATFRALGDDSELNDVWIMGMSQGATRAAALARKYPDRYTHLIAMDAPTAIKQGDLPKLRAAVLMAGERDRHDLMQASQRALQAGGIPALYLVIPEATHGAMGPTPEKTMGEALAFLARYAQSRQ